MYRVQPNSIVIDKWVSSVGRKRQGGKKEIKSWKQKLPFLNVTKPERDCVSGLICSLVIFPMFVQTAGNSLLEKWISLKTESEGGRLPTFSPSYPLFFFLFGMWEGCSQVWLCSWMIWFSNQDSCPLPLSGTGLRNGLVARKKHSNWTLYAYFQDSCVDICFLANNEMCICVCLNVLIL